MTLIILLLKHMQNTQQIILQLTFPIQDTELFNSIAKQCRICLEEERNSSQQTLLQPCKCRGSMRYVHFKCLSRWIQRSHPHLLRCVDVPNVYLCEMCKHKIQFECVEQHFCNSAETIKNKIIEKQALFWILLFLTLICLCLSITGIVLLSNGQSYEINSPFATTVLATTLSIIICLLAILIYIWMVDYFLNKTTSISKIYNLKRGTNKKKRSSSPERTESTLNTQNKSAVSRVTIFPQIVLGQMIQ